MLQLFSFSVIFCVDGYRLFWQSFRELAVKGNRAASCELQFNCRQTNAIMTAIPLLVKLTGAIGDTALSA